ncbi:hypothetical protein PMAYCL1PPCAC_14641, partial [Pristionchus mayeri]
YGFLEMEFRSEEGPDRVFRLGHDKQLYNVQVNRSIDFLCNFFEAGINKIVVNLNAIPESPMLKGHVDMLLDRLAQLKRSMNLELNSTETEYIQKWKKYPEDLTLSEGPYVRGDDEKHGRTVRFNILGCPIIR